MKHYRTSDREEILWKRFGALAFLLLISIQPVFRFKSSRVARATRLRAFRCNLG